MAFNLKLFPKASWGQSPPVPASLPKEFINGPAVEATFDTEELALAEVKKRWPKATTRSLTNIHGKSTFVFDTAFWDASWKDVPEHCRPYCAWIEPAPEAPAP